jgi:hypothetical protein
MCFLIALLVEFCSFQQVSKLTFWHGMYVSIGDRHIVDGEEACVQNVI